MSAYSARGCKVPMSVRLPRPLVERLDGYARAQGMSRTDAMVHFLERGMGEAVSAGDAELLRSIDSRLDSALRILTGIARSAEGDAAAAGPAGEGVTVDLVHAIASACSCFPAVQRAYVFGSFARGTAGPDSDVDIRVELLPDAAFNLHDLEHLSKRIEQSVGREVDVVSARKIKNEALARAIEREKVLVYEREAQ